MIYHFVVMKRKTPENIGYSVQFAPESLDSGLIPGVGDFITVPGMQTDEQVKERLFNYIEPGRMQIVFYV